MKTIGLLFLLAALPAAQASLITFSTPTGSTAGGGAVNATATFTTSANQLVITLTNLLADPGNVGQNLSDLAFNLSITNPGSSALTSSSVLALRTIASDGSYVDSNAGSSTGWALSSTGGGGVLLNVLGTPVGPAHTIVGPPNGSNLYASANDSIAHTGGPHNPFIDQSATFTLSMVGVTSDTTVTAATFSFGTTAGDNVPGTSRVPPNSIPEPASLLLMGGGVVLLGSIRRILRTRS